MGPSVSEQRWLNENPGYFSANVPRGTVAQYVKSWYDAPEQRGLQLDATDRAIYQEFFPDSPLLQASLVPAGVDILNSSFQTADSPSNFMTADVHPDTAAFIVDSAKNIMQLVDAAGNLVQWIPGSVAPFYVTAAPKINEVRLIGADANGNPILQLIDTAGTLVQWTENASQTGYVVQPFAVSTGHLPGQTATTAPSGGTTTTPPPVTTQDLSRPGKQVGSTTKGFPIYQLVDSAGTVKQWIVDPANPNVTLDLVNAQSYGAVFHDAVTDAAVTNAGGGAIITTGGSSGTTTTGGTTNQFFDPTHRSIGWDAQGKEHFIQVDEVGRIVTYASDGTGLAYAGTATKSAALIAADMLAANPYKTNPLTGQTTTPPIQNGTNTTTQKSSTAVIFLVLGAAAVWLFNERQRA